MKDVKIDKLDLLIALRKNLEQHTKIFEEALEAYRVKVVTKLEDYLDQARRGERVVEHFHIPAPVNQSHEYNRAIRMLEMSVDEHVTLTAQEFDAYVLDRWVWKQSFLIANSAYSKTASDTLSLND